MSLCWFIHEYLPQEGHADEFYKLHEERSNVTRKNWNMSDGENARVKSIDARLAEIHVEAPLPKKWKRGGEPGFMGNDLARCDILYSNDWVGEAVYCDQTPSTAQEFADDLKESLKEWKEYNPGWSTRRRGGYDDISIVQYAIRFLERWAQRGYCIHASY